jgi:hypothetical protein
MSVGRRIAGLVKRGRSEELEPETAEPVETAPVQEPEPAEPEVVVNERSARALLARGTPPLPAESPKPPRRRRLERPPEPALPEPEPAPAVATPARTWNLWELERAVRVADDQERQEEWSALFIHLREFANADGDLPVEFDALVRESFAGVLEREPEAAPS